MSKDIGYLIDISNSPQYIEAFGKYMLLKPSYFDNSIKKTYHLINNKIRVVYEDAVKFHDQLFSVQGEIHTTLVNENNNQKYSFIIHVSQEPGCINYLDNVEKFINEELKNGSNVKLHYQKVLPNGIVKNCFYDKTVEQWAKDCEILKKEDIYDEYTPYINILEKKKTFSDVSLISNVYNNILLNDIDNSSKCFAKGTEIMMWGDEEFAKKVEDIKVNDVIMGDDGQKRVVLDLVRGKEMMYKIFHGQETYTVNESHILSLYCPRDKWYVVDEENNTQTKHWIHDNVVQTQKENKKINDDIMRQLSEWSADSSSQIIDIPLRDYLLLPETAIDNLFGYSLSINKTKGVYTNREKSRQALSDKLHDNLGKYCLNIDKIDNIDEFKSLVRSLGFHYRTNRERNHVIVTSPFNKLVDQEFNDNYTDPEFRFNFAKYKNQHIIYEPICVRKLQVDDYYGFSIDGNQRFVLGNYIVTHNSKFTNSMSILLRRSVLSVNMLNFIENKEELYNLFYENRFSLPNSNQKFIAENSIIVLENFDKTIQKLHYLDKSYDNMYEHTNNKQTNKYMDNVKNLFKYSDSEDNQLRNQLFAKEFMHTEKELVEANNEIAKNSYDTYVNIINESKINNLHLSDVIELLNDVFSNKDRLIIAYCNDLFTVKDILKSELLKDMFYLSKSKMNNETYDKMTSVFYNKTLDKSYDVRYKWSHKNFLHKILKEKLTTDNFENFEKKIQSKIMNNKIKSNKETIYCDENYNAVFAGKENDGDIKEYFVQSISSDIENCRRNKLSKKVITNLTDDYISEDPFAIKIQKRTEIMQKISNKLFNNLSDDETEFNPHNNYKFVDKYLKKKNEIYKESDYRFNTSDFADTKLENESESKDELKSDAKTEIHSNLESNTESAADPSTKSDLK